MTQQSNVQKAPRIEVIDALRGLAILAILLLHNLQHFNLPVYPELSSQPEWLNMLDGVINKLTIFLFSGKAYAIFAMLFGFTFSIQYANQQKKGKDFAYRFLWRLFLLIGFAALNAAFFPAGDVLLKFALVGILLVIVRKWSDTAIFITAVILLAGPMEWYHYIRHLINPAYILPEWGGIMAMFDEIIAVAQSGDFWNFLWTNISLGMITNLFYAGLSGQIFQQAGLFLIGLLIGRKQLFVTSEKSNQFWIKGLITAIVLYFIFYFIDSKLISVRGSIILQGTVGKVFDMWQKLSFTLVLVASFVLLYQRELFKKMTSYLRYYGKMSLTNYVSQSIFGAVIYFPFGLYLAPHCGFTISFLIGFAIFFIQIFLCNRWLKNHKQGPLEGLWHKLTWIK